MLEVGLGIFWSGTNEDSFFHMCFAQHDHVIPIRFTQLLLADSIVKLSSINNSRPGVDEIETDCAKEDLEAERHRTTPQRVPQQEIERVSWWILNSSFDPRYEILQRKNLDSLRQNDEVKMFRGSPFLWFEV